jgi:hypothetical protein
MSDPKPRVNFCWECGRKLRGNYHVELVVDGHKRIVHKQCSPVKTICRYKPPTACGIPCEKCYMTPDWKETDSER